MAKQFQSHRHWDMIAVIPHKTTYPARNAFFQARNRPIAKDADSDDKSSDTVGAHHRPFTSLGITPVPIPRQYENPPSPVFLFRINNQYSTPLYDQVFYYSIITIHCCNMKIEVHIDVRNNLLY